MELMKVKDRHQRDYVLSPVSIATLKFIFKTCNFNHAAYKVIKLVFQTHEEAITDLVASLPQLTYKQLPLKLYQITNKFRDEIKPRFGLLRGREFIMKDLYTFDKSVEEARETYELICQAYKAIFVRLGVPYVKGLKTIELEKKTAV